MPYISFPLVVHSTAVHFGCPHCFHCPSLRRRCFHDRQRLHHRHCLSILPRFGTTISAGLCRSSVIADSWLAATLLACAACFRRCLVCCGTSTLPSRKVRFALLRRQHFDLIPTCTAMSMRLQQHYRCRRHPYRWLKQTLFTSIPHKM